METLFIPEAQLESQHFYESSTPSIGVKASSWDLRALYVPYVFNSRPLAHHALLGSFSWVLHAAGLTFVPLHGSRCVSNSQQRGLE